MLIYMFYAYSLESTRVIYKTVSSIIVVQFITSIITLRNVTSFRACAYESNDIVTSLYSVKQYVQIDEIVTSIRDTFASSATLFYYAIFKHIVHRVPGSLIRMVTRFQGNHYLAMFLSLIIVSLRCILYTILLRNLILDLQGNVYMWKILFIM